MTDRERLVAVETKLTLVQETVSKIYQKMDVLIPTFATQAHVAEVKQDMEEKMLTIRQEIAFSKRRSATQTGVTSVLSAILGAVLAILVQSYLTK